jgi:nucleoside-diphosphate-sugar epimerase
MINTREYYAIFDSFENRDYESKGFTERIKQIRDNLKESKGIIAVYGIGKVGSSVAHNLLKLGYTVIGVDKELNHDRDRFIKSPFPTNYIPMVADYNKHGKLALLKAMQILEVDQIDKAFHTFIQNKRDANEFIRVVRDLTTNIGMMSTVHTFQNLDSREYIISENSPKITPDSLEHGRYGLNKREAEIELLGEAQKYNIKTLMIYCNHIIGANIYKERIISGYPLGLTTDFRVLSKSKLEEKKRFILPNIGYNEYNIIDLDSLGSIIALAIHTKMKGDLIIANPLAITARKYLIESAIAHNVIYDDSTLQQFENKIANYTGPIEKLNPRSMQKPWRLDSSKMQALLESTNNLSKQDWLNSWESSMDHSFKQSTQVDIDPKSKLIQRML